jgi:LPPG:FO 2-phospho-L-lactate transferase
VPALEFIPVGAEEAAPAPGVIEAINEADAVLVAPSNPVVSIAPILAVPGIRDAVRQRPVVGVSPIVGGAPVRGHADACLSAIGVATDAMAVALHYGARRDGGLLDGWIVDLADAGSLDVLEGTGIKGAAVPAIMSDASAAATLAEHVMSMALAR